MFKDNQNKLLKVLVKSMVCSLSHDLYNFGTAKRNCHKHVLHTAEVRHEPTRLINGTIWGVNLFLPDLVREAIDNASKVNLTLWTRLGLQEKRKLTEESGPQPNNKCSRRGSFRASQAQRGVFPMALPVSLASSSGQGARGHQQFVLVPSPHHSLVSNLVYEGQTMSFRVAGFNPQRGGRGRGGRGGGQYH